ncbi:2-oxoglutarate dehydrogenase complex dihydrolipoyllysine-residue succinyltransferase [Candidatus Sulfidibacterium hydrothermale]|uniref:2-oxoglutarate dehydrogenase complex dihydrolipoyllysine-residue succinyltransferase n=1 Tax=Candidatus Sulfidibacterium hydrothermale TaxID=2875962 RepID=UPI001F0A77F8|nr:2-oxoglutarate dehydrogenase complex dihydrolipoyllysine-residue succinyltransferase [Candidatus Sulfidibacterium hydrothermale]UBM62080.1 2-oxoglutarate dehydrogenase complex dihydrolipoyllysine-residue succinyltransferase [Candidatus Sulfidibacterium hydrothermale]
MKVEIKVPSPGESITEVQLAAWLVKDGQQVEKDQDIVEIDSDKATLTVAAEADGKIKLLAKEGDTIEVGSVLAVIDTEVKGEAPDKPVAGLPEDKKTETPEKEAPKNAPEEKQKNRTPEEDKTGEKLHLSPLARKLLQQEGATEKELAEFFRSVRIGKEDVRFFLENRNQQPRKQATAATKTSWTGERNIRREKMSMLRKKLAQRLVSVKNETAMLTTFNEVDMSAIMEIRRKYKEIFKEKFGVGLGFMSFFTKAVTEALQLFPQVNAQISGDELIYFDYVDIGIAVSAPKGLVVPVIQDAEKMSLAEIETAIKTLAVKARENKITLDEMQGGTFTITNGGVFGSMMSTPILNPPQSAILGMHNIVKRPVAVNGKVEIHPMMYVALSYDHRIIDGRESVGFLVKVKEMLEQPQRMLFGARSAEEVLLDL